MDLPQLTVDLVPWLDKQTPERCPTPDMDDRLIWMYAGKRELIRSLQAQLAVDEDNPMDQKVITNVHSQGTQG